MHSEYVLQEKYQHTPLTDVMGIHFLNLEAAKKAKEKHTPDKLINWLCFIGATDKKERAMLAAGSPILQMLNEKLDVVTLSPVERKLYESRMKLKSDITTIAETQFSAGMQQGIAQGITQGIAQGKSEGLLQGFSDGMRQTAKLLKQLGDPLQKIVQVTGLSPAEIETL